MVEEDLEVAKVLADLAFLALRESCGGDSVGIRSRKGKRVNGRFL